MGKYEANVEFLSFLADVTDSGTGVILIARLARWLGLEPHELEDRWVASGCEDWRDFADNVLRVLDAMQDQTDSLAVTLVWYRHAPIADQEARSADELVVAGSVDRAIALVQQTCQHAVKKLPSSLPRHPPAVGVANHSHTSSHDR